jgi:uncharacterized protein YcnI
MRNSAIAVSVLMLLATTAAQAHVRIFPAESVAGATENYTMYVPTEGKVNTTGVDLEVPDGVTIVSVDGPADGYSIKKSGARIVSVSWKMNIPPGQNQAFKFVATNPKSADHISWMAHQHLADGSSEGWVDVPGSKRPAPVIKLGAAKP